MWKMWKWLQDVITDTWNIERDSPSLSSGKIEIQYIRKDIIKYKFNRIKYFELNVYNLIITYIR